MKPVLPLALALLAATPLAAHPHVFVDSSLRLSLDAQKRVVSVEVTWVYDDFFTLLILEDMGLDPDGDGVLSEAELAQLKGFDLVEWPEGFEGDLYMYEGEEKLALGHPEPLSVAVTDGRIVATHRRSVPEAPAEGLRILQYDPTYYVAYEVTGGVEVTAPCQATITRPDPDEAAAAAEKDLQTIPEDMYQVLEVGIHYADRITVSCDAPS